MKKLLFFVGFALLLCACSSSPRERPATVAKQEPNTKLFSTDENLAGISPTDVIYMMTEPGIFDTPRNAVGRISVTYMLLKDSSVLVLKHKNVIAPYTKEQAKLIMLTKMRMESKE